MKTAVVTGGTGFLGRHMIEVLKENNYEIYAVVRPNSPNLASLPKGEHIHPVSCELSQIQQKFQEMDLKFDVFFHFAWGGVNRQEIDDDSVHQKNIALSLDCVKAAIAAGCQCFVDAGSRIEYGRCDGMFREDLVCEPLVAYGRAKIVFAEAARKLCAGTGMRFLHARIYSVFGTDDHKWSLIYTSVTRMLRNEPLDLSLCTHKWNFMYVTDTVELLLALYEQRDRIPEDDNGIFNIATDDIRPLREFIESIRKLTGSQSVLNFGAFHQGAESAMSILPDMTKVNRMFDWKPRYTFEDGIRCMIEDMED